MSGETAPKLFPCVANGFDSLIALSLVPSGYPDPGCQSFRVRMEERDPSIMREGGHRLGSSTSHHVDLPSYFITLSSPLKLCTP